MKRREKELRVAYGMKAILLYMMESYNPDSMDQDFVSEKFNTIMVSLYDHHHRRISGNWMYNQNYYWHDNSDTNSHDGKGYEFSNYYARRCWDGIIEDPYEGAPIKVPYDKSIITRMDEYVKISDLDIPHFMWDSTMCFKKVRFIRVAFRTSRTTSDGETLTIERGYELDATGTRTAYPFVEHWYEDDYEYPYAYYEEDYTEDDCDEDDSYDDYDYGEYEDDDEYDEYWDDGCPIEDETSIRDAIELDREFDEMLING